MYYYSLTVENVLGTAEIQLCVREQRQKKAGTSGKEKPRLLGYLKQQMLNPVTNEISYFLRKNNVSFKDLIKGTQTCAVLEENDALRLTLLFNCLTMAKSDKAIQSLVTNICALSDEEVSYWYSLSFTYKTKTFKALRVLFST